MLVRAKAIKGIMVCAGQADALAAVPGGDGECTAAQGSQESQGAARRLSAKARARALQEQQLFQDLSYQSERPECKVSIQSAEYGFEVRSGSWRDTP